MDKHASDGMHDRCADVIKLVSSDDCGVIPPKFTNAIVVMTGGSSGIGRAIAEALLTNGAMVINMGRGNYRYGVPRWPLFVHISCDLKDPESIYRACDKAHATAPHIDVLINCAAILPRIDYPIGERSAVMCVNYLAHFQLMMMCNDLLKLSSCSLIVNVVSDTYRYARIDCVDSVLEYKRQPGIMSYARSKHALMAVAAYISTTCDQRSVCVHPGTALTGLYNELPQFTRCLAKLLGRSPERIAAMVCGIITEQRTNPATSKSKSAYYVRRKMRGDIDSFVDPRVGCMLFERSACELGLNYGTLLAVGSLPTVT